MPAGIATGSPSRAPSGSMYAQLWSRSTTPVSSCSDPIGSWIATQRSESCSCSDAERAVEVGALAVEHVDEDDARELELLGARPDARRCSPPRPSRRRRRRARPRRRAGSAIVSAWKPESPGVSIRLIFRPCHSRCASDAASDIWRRCSSSSQSLTVVPASIVPSRLIAPAWKSSASTSEVLPVPRWPTTATLRIFPGSMGIAAPPRTTATGRRKLGTRNPMRRRWIELPTQVVNGSGFIRRSFECVRVRQDLRPKEDPDESAR